MLRWRSAYLSGLFLLSLLLHLLVLKSFQIGTAMAKPALEKQDEYIEVVPVELKDLDLNSARQVIELPPGPDQQPEFARYLSERAMKAEKETMAPPGKPIAGHSSAPVSSQNLFQKPKSQEQGEIELAEKLKPEPMGSSNLFEDKPGSIDFLEGAASGEVTLANAYKFRYAYFFNQLKRSISFYWNPLPALHLVPDSTGDLITTIRFALDQNGLLQDLEVISSSGFQAIDRAALNAIKSATPVFSVPEDLLDQNQQLVIVCEFRLIR